jgi:hypothetical protein
MKLLWVSAGLVLFSHPLAAQPAGTQFPAGVSVSEPLQTVTIRESTTVREHPDVLYLLMKLETEGAQLAHAIEQNQRKLAGFIAALQRLPVDHDAIRAANFVVTGVPLGRGVTFTRNVIIPVSAVDRRTVREIEALIAQVQDLGARHGSHCVTCIGSG